MNNMPLNITSSPLRSAPAIKREHFFFILLIIACFFNSKKLQSQTIDHWETIVYNDDVWQYQLGNTAPDPAWNLPSFSANNWLVGQGGIGYGDNDDNTIISSTNALFIRREFEVVDLTKLVYAVLHADYDDAFVAYLNGTEIARANIAGEPPVFTDFATGEHEAELYNMGLPTAYFITKEKIMSCLQNGTNLLAVQIHNVNATSSDMSSNFFLSAGIEDESNDYGPTPSWFFLPANSSHLPIIKINTNGLNIPDEPGIIADIGIIHNDVGLDNFITDDFNEYAGKIDIEIRGQSSQTFNKKNYGFETIDINGEDIDTSFLGFPKEEDWILHGPYSDKTLMRNVLTMHLAREMGQYASRTRFCELYINDNYQGVYVLMEKIKRNEERVDISKLKPEDVEGDELTGGYIFKVDKGDPNWSSNYNAINTGNLIGFQYVYPRADDIQLAQANYIQSYVDSFERALIHPNYYFGGKRYDEYIDVNSFAENFLLNEFSKNIDAYRISSYFFKQKDSKGGKMFAGPVWDYNLAWRNADFCFGDAYEEIHYFHYCGNQVFWWNRMLQDPVFVNLMTCRWESLREGAFHQDTIFEFIDQQVALLGDAADRNFMQWQTLGNYVWPNPLPYAQTYDEEILQMKNWISNRLSWLDNYFSGECQTLSTQEEITRNSYLTIFPNPANELLHISYTLPQNKSILKIINHQGQLIRSQEISQEKELSIPIQTLANGIYYLQIINNKQSLVKKFVKQ